MHVCIHVPVHQCKNTLYVYVHVYRDRYKTYRLGDTPPPVAPHIHTHARTHARTHPPTTIHVPNTPNIHTYGYM